jgi:hypothetical protein
MVDITELTVQVPSKTDTKMYVRQMIKQPYIYAQKATVDKDLGNVVRIVRLLEELSVALREAGELATSIAYKSWAAKEFLNPIISELRELRDAANALKVSTAIYDRFKSVKKEAVEHTYDSVVPVRYVKSFVTALNTAEGIFRALFPGAEDEKNEAVEQFVAALQKLWIHVGRLMGDPAVDKDVTKRSLLRLYTNVIRELIDDVKKNGITKNVYERYKHVKSGIAKVEKGL